MSHHSSPPGEHPNGTYIVYWFDKGDSEFDKFDTLDEANTALLNYRSSYPDNTYFLAKNVETAPNTRAASLTNRQREILGLVLIGNTSKNIAADLGISQRTVENHRAAIMAKMGVRCIAALVRVGIAAE